MGRIGSTSWTDGSSTGFHQCIPRSADRAGVTPMSAPSTTRTFKIAAIPADGVGIEVVAAGRAVLDAIAAASDGAFAFDWTEFPWGCGYYEKTGRMMDEDGLEVLQAFDALYFGAVGWPTVPDHISLWGLRLNIA